MLNVTAQYAGILGLLLIGVAFPAGAMRGRRNIPVGDGGDKDLWPCGGMPISWSTCLSRSSYIGVLELNHVRPLVLHILGAGLVLARVCHAYGIRSDSLKVPRGLSALR